MRHELRKVEWKNRIPNAEVVWRSGDERMRQKREEREKDHLWNSRHQLSVRSKAIPFKKCGVIAGLFIRVQTLSNQMKDLKSLKRGLASTEPRKVLWSILLYPHLWTWEVELYASSFHPQLCQCLNSLMEEVRDLFHPSWWLFDALSPASSPIPSVPNWSSPSHTFNPILALDHNTARSKHEL